MAIDWNDSKKRKAFKEALILVYPSIDELKIFVDEELNANLDAVAGQGKLEVIAYNLVVWANAQGRLNELYDAFKKENLGHDVIKTIERQSLIPPTSNLIQNDWDTLFQQFLLDDLADLRRAFGKGFREAIGIDFRVAQPKYPSLVELSQIRELLEDYDRHTVDKRPILAVRFVEFAIAELRRSSEGNERDLTALEQWCDRIAQQFNVPPFVATEPKTPRHAYLLVALKKHGSDVNVYPELHITGEETPVKFGAKPTTCPLDQVAAQISDWIRLAEEALDDTCDDEEIILEMFLPCEQLETDIANTWYVKNKRGDEICLGTHRRFLVRSSDRIRDRQIQKALKRKWQELETCVKEQNACTKFHPVENCPQQKGELLALLQDNNAPGLKLIAPLPTDPLQRKALLFEIIDAAIPIALWSSDEVADAETLKTEFDDLLSQSHLTNFADLARQWREQRRNSTWAKSFRLLCDHPDRWPKLPDPTQDQDLLVAS